MTKKKIHYIRQGKEVDKLQASAVDTVSGYVDVIEEPNEKSKHEKEYGSRLVNWSVDDNGDVVGIRPDGTRVELDD